MSFVPLNTAPGHQRLREVQQGAQVFKVLFHEAALTAQKSLWYKWTRLSLQV